MVIFSNLSCLTFLQEESAKAVANGKPKKLQDSDEESSDEEEDEEDGPPKKKIKKAGMLIIFN